MLNINLFWPVISSEEDFRKIYHNFPYFALYWAPKRASPFISTHMNPQPPSMMHANFG